MCNVQKSVNRVCLGSVASSGCMSDDLEFKTEFRGWLFSAWVISVYLFGSVICFGGVGFL